MPFRSRKQLRYFAAAEARGELPKGTFKRWRSHTPNVAKLPEKATEKKAYLVGVEMALKLAGTAGKETRLKRDHNRFDFFSVRRHFERAGKHNKEVGDHAPLVAPEKKEEKE